MAQESWSDEDVVPQAWSDEDIATPKAAAEPDNATMRYLKALGSGVGQGALGMAGSVQKGLQEGVFLPPLLQPFARALAQRMPQAQQLVQRGQEALRYDVPKGGGEYWTQAAGRGIGAGLLSPTAVVPNALAGMGGQLGEDLATPLLGEKYGPLAGQLAGGFIGGKVGDFAMKPAPQITNPAQRAQMDYAEREYGMTFPPGQYTGSRGLKNLEAGLEALPGGTGPYQATRDKNLDILTKRTAKAMGVKDATDLGPDTLNAAFTGATKLMNAGLPDSARVVLKTGTRVDTKTLKNTPARKFASEWEIPNTAVQEAVKPTFKSLDDVLDEIYREELSKRPIDQSKKVLDLVDGWRRDIGRPMSGEGLKATRSEYKAEARRALSTGSTDTDTYKVAAAKNKIADAFDDAIEASLGGEQAAMYKRGRQLYWAAERVQESNPSSTGHNVSPKLAETVRAKNTDYYNQAPQGQSEMVDLARTSAYMPGEMDSFLGRANIMSAVRGTGQTLPALFGGGAGWALSGGNPMAALGGAAIGQFAAPAAIARMEMSRPGRAWLKHGMPKAFGTATPEGANFPRTLGLAPGLFGQPDAFDPQQFDAYPDQPE